MRKIILALCFVLFLAGFPMVDAKYTNDQIVSLAREELNISPVENTTVAVVYHAYICAGVEGIEKPENMNGTVSLFPEEDIPLLYRWEEDVFIRPLNKHIIASKLALTEDISMIAQAWNADYTVKRALAFGPGNKIYELDPATGEPLNLAVPLNC